MSFNIRPMMASDLHAIEIIQAEAYAGYFLECAQVIEQRFTMSPTTAWVAEHEDVVCAYLVGYWSKVGKVNPLNAVFHHDENPNCLYLHDLALLKTAEGYGVGKKLIQAATDHALQHAVEAIALLSVQNSKSFWQAFGFSEFLHLSLPQQKNVETYQYSSDPALYMVKSL